MPGVADVFAGSERQPSAISRRPLRGPSQRRREGHAVIGGRPGEPERPIAHQLGEKSVGRAALHRPHGLRPAPPVCLLQRRSRLLGPGAAALHEGRAAGLAFRGQHRRHRSVLPAPRLPLRTHLHYQEKMQRSTKKSPHPITQVGASLYFWPNGTCRTRPVLRWAQPERGSSGSWP